MKTYFARIVTFISHPPLPDSAKDILAMGSREITLKPKQRFFAVRKVFYDDSITPLYSIPSMGETWYGSIEELMADPHLSSKLFDAPILEIHNSMKVYDPK